MRTVPQAATARGNPTPDPDACEGAELADENPKVERIIRRLCRINYVETQHWQALNRLADERTRLEVELAAIEDGRP
jgi:hypothetical protein